MADPDAVRASGSTQVDEITRSESDVVDQDIEASLDLSALDIAPRTPSFQRIKTEWTGEEGDIVRGLQTKIDDRVREIFADAYMILEELYDIVRVPEKLSDGRIVIDQAGKKVWKRNFYGDWEENWNILTRGEQEHFLYAITTRLFIWRQRADRVWTEAMLAKAQWEERFSIAYGEVDYSVARRDTVDARTSYAKADASDERYLAVFLAALSRRASSVVSSMELIAQRMKDVMTA